ncbi:hypothetical protein AS180_04035 [Priestia veravalensis]|uniref:Uncharacterized protein n=1 Tax=Priestia veravalensis TaxID=1414648 RepID=A0A0V8JQ43_9BACI|nr:hypothetical protein AS180_04035 [Priestia veravalensis]SCB93868.1 hypothetical protein GA0061087_1004131 [Priestia flexa]
MSKLFTYFPLICFLIILLGLEESVMKWALLVFMAIGILIAKNSRKNMQSEEVEYDDRVNSNITKWSLRTMYVMNALLFIMLVLENYHISLIKLNINFILIYLLITLFIPFYIIPLIIKKF